jgi:hypothetical protein
MEYIEGASLSFPFYKTGNLVSLDPAFFTAVILVFTNIQKKNERVSQRAHSKTYTNPI